MVILVLKEIIEYVFITRKGGNVINIEETVSNTRTNEMGTNTRFKKKKGGKDDKVVEGFVAQCTGTPGTITSPLAPVPTNCEKATWLFCDDNFAKLIAILTDYDTKLAPILTDYDTKLAPILTDYDDKLAPILTDYDKLSNILDLPVEKVVLLKELTSTMDRYELGDIDDINGTELPYFKFNCSMKVYGKFNIKRDLDVYGGLTVSRSYVPAYGTRTHSLRVYGNVKITDDDSENIDGSTEIEGKLTVGARSCSRDHDRLVVYTGAGSYFFVNKNQGHGIINNGTCR